MPINSPDYFFHDRNDCYFVAHIRGPKKISASRTNFASFGRRSINRKTIDKIPTDKISGRFCTESREGMEIRCRGNSAREWWKSAFAFAGAREIRSWEISHVWKHVIRIWALFYRGKWRLWCVLTTDKVRNFAKMENALFRKFLGNRGRRSAAGDDWTKNARFHYQISFVIKLTFRTLPHHDFQKYLIEISRLLATRVEYKNHRSIKLGKHISSRPNIAIGDRSLRNEFDTKRRRSKLIPPVIEATDVILEGKKNAAFTAWEAKNFVMPRANSELTTIRLFLARVCTISTWNNGLVGLWYAYRKKRLFASSLTLSQFHHLYRRQSELVRAFCTRNRGATLSTTSNDDWKTAFLSLHKTATLKSVTLFWKTCFFIWKIGLSSRRQLKTRRDFQSASNIDFNANSHVCHGNIREGPFRTFITAAQVQKQRSDC